MIPMSRTTPTIPHLTTAMHGPIGELERKILQHQPNIEAWLRGQWRLTPPPITSSVDLRNAGIKVAPVDTNLFPAGFNNLNPEFLPLSIQAAQATFYDICPGTVSMMIIPENHTRNKFYFESLGALQEIICKAGFKVRIGSLVFDKPQTIELASGRTIILEPITRVDNRLQLNDYKPCMILLNNDLSDGIPEILQNIEQPIRPSPYLGWSKRTKTSHFTHFAKVAKEVADLIDIDPWLIQPYFDSCDHIDFMAGDGNDCLLHKVDHILNLTRQKYREYAIEQSPFVVVKADAGTYGMGVMMVTDVNQLASLNRKQRTKMSSSKGSKAVDRVIIQEGIYTFEKVGANQAVAEPVVYMMGQHVIGGFYRVHAERGDNENLNAPGMHFEPLAFAQCCNNPIIEGNAENHLNRFYIYGVIARLALVAAAREMQEVIHEH